MFKCACMIYVCMIYIKDKDVSMCVYDICMYDIYKYYYYYEQQSIKIYESYRCRVNERYLNLQMPFDYDVNR